MKIIFFIFLIITIFVNATKGQSSTLDIQLKNPDPVQYCTSPVLVAKDLSIEGNPNIVGMKISFSGGYKANEDELVYTGALSKVWYVGSGTLLLTGTASTTVKDYVDAIRTITYKNNSSTPTLGVRKITISLSDVDYLDYTGHFYRFVSQAGMSWTDARDQAAATLYYGLKGYLATITSQVENDFIRTKTTGVGWIGASDAAIEGEWRWVTGPEGLENNGQGRLFWKGTGFQAKSNPASYGSVNGAYQNWNMWDVPYSASTVSTTWEPNNMGNENYAHITVFPKDPNDSYKWNDLANAGGTGDYASRGYLIEFGGSSGDPDVHVMATLDLQVNTMLFKNDLIPAICEGTSVTLNQPDLYTTVAATYSWNPDPTLSATDIANPVATPANLPTSSYIVNGTRGTCNNTKTFTVPVNPKPISLLKPKEDICNGSSITLDPGLFKNYDWGSGITTQTIPVSTSGDYTVTLTSDNGCKATSTSKVIVHDYPTIDLSNLQSLICGEPKSTTVNIISSISDYTLTSTNTNVTTNGLNVTVNQDGIYPMTFTANDKFCPVPKDFNLSFYKIPEGVLSVTGQAEGQKCFGYNLNATFTPTGDLSRANYEWNFGGEIIPNDSDPKVQSIPLGISQLNRDLKLTVTQDGCPNTFTEPNILVIPQLNLTVDNNNKVCAPLDVVFTATSAGAINFVWDFGDKILFYGPNSIQPHTYQEAGYFDVNLKVTTVDDCTNEVKIPKMVHAAPIPVVTFSLSPTDCLEPGPNEVYFTGTGLNGTGKDQYIWDLNDFTASEQLNNPQATPGPFKFDLITKPSAKLGLQVVSEFGCESAPENIILNRKPDFTISSDVMAGCIPFEPKLSGVINDPIDKVDFTWDITDGSTGSGSPYSPTFNKPDTIYSVTLTGKSSVTQCSNVVTKTGFLKTYPQPKAAFSMDNAVVYSDKPDVKFTDLSEGATSWLWNFGDGKTSILQNPAYHFMKVGHQTILLKVTNSDQCTDTASQKLLVAFDRLFPPNGFSPNAPNKVDREFLLNSDGVSIEGYHLTVLSRWNDLVFEAKDEIKGWDGRMNNGALAPAGVYVWVLNYTDFLGRRHQQTGTVTLVY